MSLKFSQGVVNAVAQDTGWGNIIRNGVCVVYSGQQPTSPEVAAVGANELVRFTLDGNAFTPEVNAACWISLTGATGNVEELTIGGIPLFDTNVLPVFTSISALVTSVIAAINNTFTALDYYAVPSGTTIGSVTYGVANTADFYIIAPKNSGASLNAQEVVCAVASGTPPAINDGDSTTIGGTSGIAGVAAVNGLSILYPAVGGVMSKSGNWKGTASASGTAGWFRILCTPNYDAGTTTLATTGDDAYRIMRIDGNVSTSGADMLVSSAVITSGIEQAVTSFSFTVPAA